jgi:hypothetical protein
LYRPSKYLRAALAMASWHFWSGVSPAIASDAETTSTVAAPATNVIDLMGESSPG